jgi:uncharacterized protein
MLECDRMPCAPATGCRVLQRPDAVCSSDRMRYAQTMRSEMLEGAKLFNAGEYWEAHEIWEVPWNAARTAGDTTAAAYVQGLILLAAAIHKRRHYDNLRGGKLNYEKALRKLEVVPVGYSRRDGFDLEAFKLEVLRALEDDGLQPQLPV